MADAAKFRVREALAFLQKSYTEHRLPLSHVAKQVGVSPGHLSRLFTKCTGKHFRHHLRTIRMEHAAELLKNPVLSVKEISWMVGYQHASTFDRDFRACHGTSPIKYRCL